MTSNGSWPWLAPAPGAKAANVAAQDGDDRSLLSLYRRLIALRNRLDVFGTGELVEIEHAEKDNVLVFARDNGAARTLVAINFAADNRSVILDLRSWVRSSAKAEIYLTRPAPLSSADAGSYGLVLPPYGYVIWSLD